MHFTVRSCHVVYAFQSESPLYSCLNVEEVLTWSRNKIRSLSDCNRTQTQNHLVHKRTLKPFIQTGQMTELCCVFSEGFSLRAFYFDFITEGFLITYKTSRLVLFYFLTKIYQKKINSYNLNIIVTKTGSNHKPPANNHKPQENDHNQPINNQNPPGNNQKPSANKYKLPANNKKLPANICKWSPLHIKPKSWCFVSSFHTQFLQWPPQFWKTWAISD